MKAASIVKNIAVSLIVLGVSFGISLLLHQVFDVKEPITTVFVFAVFVISLITPGFVYGICSAFAATVAVNYAFTFPYFAIDFTTPINLISGLVMIVIAVLTGMLTTQLKRHEAVKAESEKERMRANLLRAVSHDLRTPLTTIYGASTTLLENRETFSDDQQEQMLRGITEDAEWLTRIVENLLSVTRLDGGTVKIIKTPTVLDDLLDAVLRTFQKRYPTQQVEVELPEDIVLIPMDAMLIEQVLLNILENAVQHAEGMTKLTVLVSTCGDKAIFEVCDNGCGITPQRLERLFEGYYESKTHPADSRKKNAGIGLSVCASIIKAHGGEIEAENRSTGGAVFRFILNTEVLDHDE